MIQLAKRSLAILFFSLVCLSVTTQALAVSVDESWRRAYAGYKFDPYSGRRTAYPDMITPGIYDKTATMVAASKDPDTNIYDLHANVANRQQSQLQVSSTELTATMVDTAITADFTHDDVWRDDVDMGLYASSIFTMYFTPETDALLTLTGNFTGTDEAFYADFSFGRRGNYTFNKKIGGGLLSRSFSFSDTLSAGQLYQFAFYGNLLYEGKSDAAYSTSGHYDFELLVKEDTGQGSEAVPEPATVLLMGLGLVGMVIRGRKRR